MVVLGATTVRICGIWDVCAGFGWKEWRYGFENLTDVSGDGYLEFCDFGLVSLGLVVAEIWMFLSLNIVIICHFLDVCAQFSWKEWSQRFGIQTNGGEGVLVVFCNLDLRCLALLDAEVWVFLSPGTETICGICDVYG